MAYSDKQKLQSNCPFILQASNRFLLQAIASYEIPFNSLVNLLVLAFHPAIAELGQSGINAFRIRPPERIS